jgi:predicted RNase H-like nuclease (RuvC/YqgF family)
MKSDFQCVSSLRKKFETLNPYRPKNDSEVVKASSTTNLCDTKKTRKYENCSAERLVKMVKQLKKENKELRKCNEKQAEKIKELIDEINKVKGKAEDSSRPISCLRNSNSVPKRNRVMFSRELVQVLNETTDKKKKTFKVKEEQGVSYHFAVKKVTRRPKPHESHSPLKQAEENEYYTPLSCSLQDKRVFSQTAAKQFDISPKFREKQKVFTKIARF